jgi:hypothetical protein
MAQSIRENAVSIKGTIQNALAHGLTPIHAVSEKIDNPLDFGAKNIHVEMFETESQKTFLVSSDCGGMTLEELCDSGYMNNRKPGSNNKNGLMGFGNTASDIVLTEHKYPSLTIAKTPTGTLVQTIRDYPTAIKDDRMLLIATEVTLSNERKWVAHATNKNHGVLTILQIPDTIYNQLKTSWMDMIKHFSKAYTYYIQQGVSLTFVLNGKRTVITQNVVQDTAIHILPPFRIHTATITSKDIKYNDYAEPSRYIEVWRKPNTSEVYLRYKDKRGKYHNYGIESELPADFERLDDIVYNISYNEEYNTEDGGMYIHRNQKVLDIHKPQPMNSDDFYKRKINTDCRESIHTTSHHDAVLNLLVNKSRITQDSINKNLLTISKEFKKKFLDEINRLRNVHMKKAKTSPPNVNVKASAIKPVAAAAGGGGGGDGGGGAAKGSHFENNNSPSKNVIVPTTPPNSVPKITVNKVQNALATAPAPTPAPTPAPAQRKIVAKHSIPCPPNSVVQIGAHQRSLSKSPLEIVLKLEQLKNTLNSMNFTMIKTTQSNVAQSGLVHQHNAIETILHYLTTHNQKN